MNFYYAEGKPYVRTISDMLAKPEQTPLKLGHSIKS